MYSNKSIKVLAICLILGCISSVTFADAKHSNNFQYKYEGDFFPSDTNTSPIWERDIWGGLEFETYYCSVSSGIFTIDTAKNPTAGDSAYYLMPGEYSSMSNEQFYTYGDAGNPWNVDFASGYTLEVKFKMDGIQDPCDPAYPGGKFAFWLQSREGLHGQINNVQIFPDKIVAVNSTTTILYSGDLTDKFYTLRIVRNPSALDVTQNLNDYYLDDVLIAEGVSSNITSAYNQDDFVFGDAARGYGGTDIKVEIDYLRFDMTGAYTPAYLITDINKDRVTDFADFAALAQNWLLYSDPDIGGYIDCSDPINAAICQ